VIRGGNLNNGGNAGVGYVNVNNELGNRNANIGSRLGTKTKIKSACAYPEPSPDSGGVD